MMKLKVAAIILAAVAIFTGCGNQKNVSSNVSSAPVVAEPALKDGVTLSSLMEETAQKYGMTMPAALDDQILKELMGVDPEDVEEYAGYLTMVSISTDHMVAVKAKPGKVDAVKEGLESRRAFMEESFSRYLPYEYEKAKAGKVFQIGNYVFLIITGDMDTMETDPAIKIAEVEADIRAAFH